MMQIASPINRNRAWHDVSAGTLYSPVLHIRSTVVHRSVLSLYLIVFVYLFSGQPLDTRDPLGTSLDWHIYAQIGLFVLALCGGAIVWLRSKAPLAWHPPSQLFLAFGLFAVLSSYRSFWPPLSLVKGCLFIFVVLLSEMLCAAYSARQVLQASYYAVLLVLLSALVLGILLPDVYPLIVVDTVGRHRFCLFTDENGDFGYLTGMAALLGRLPCIRAPWFFQLALIALTVLSGSRACTVALLAIIGVLGVLRLPDFRVKAAVCLGGIALVGGIQLIAAQDQMTMHGVQHLLAGFYGDTAVQQSPTDLSGRLELWQSMGGILSQCIVLGKGFDGTRDQLMRILFWAGAAHNELLELMLSGGMIAATAFLYGWFIVIKRGLRPDIMKATLPFHAFVFLVSFTGQSLTMFRAFGTLLLVGLQYWTLEGVYSHDH